TIFIESPTRTHMFVYTPGVEASATPFEWLAIRAGYEADIVSGASVATKAGPAYAATHPGADVISTASVHDFRSQFNGGFTLKKDIVNITGGYTFSTEHDYKSNAFFVSARTEPYEHDTQFEISYARNFDRVCDRVQGANDPPSRHVALEDSTGCFTESTLRT